MLTDTVKAAKEATSFEWIRNLDQYGMVGFTPQSVGVWRTRPDPAGLLTEIRRINRTRETKPLMIRKGPKDGR